MPVTGAPRREEEPFVLDAGNASTSGGIVALRLPTTLCTFLAQSRVEYWRVGQRQATREIDDQFLDILGGATPNKAALFQERCHGDSLPQNTHKGTFRAEDPVANEDLLPVKHVTFDFSERGHRGHRESRRLPGRHV